MLLKRQFPYERLKEQAENLREVITSRADEFIHTIFNILKNSNDEFMHIRIELINNLKQYVKLCGPDVLFPSSNLFNYVL